MAYDGWLSYAGVEIANVPRLQAYVKGMAPGLLRNCDCDCDLLAEALDDKPYTNPLTDRAPWVDPTDEDTWNFYGVMPLSISGLQDSTREVPITQNVRDGGFIGPGRKRTKEFRLRGLMVARDEAALEAGYSWFMHVTSNAGCGGGCLGEGERFCYLSSCPTELTDIAGMETVEVGFEGLGQGWREVLKANWPGQVWEQPTPPGTHYRWTGTPHASASEKVVNGEVVATNYATTPQGGPGSPTISGWGSNNSGAYPVDFDTSVSRSGYGSMLSTRQDHTSSPHVAANIYGLGNPYNQSGYPPDPQGEWAASVHVRATDPSVPLRGWLALQYRGSDNTILDSTNGPWIEFPSDGEWHALDVTAPQAPANTDRITMSVQVETTDSSPVPVGHETWLTDATLAPTPTSYFDGDTPYAPLGAYHRWTGSPHASTSERVVDGEIVARNLVHNPSVVGLTGIVESGEASLSVVEGGGPHGQNALRVDVPALPGSMGFRTEGYTQPPDVLDEGQAFSASLWVKVPEGVLIQWETRTLGEGSEGRNEVVNLPGTGEWEQIAFSASRSFASRAPYLIGRRTLSDDPMVFYATSFIVTPGATLPDYFDGDTPDDRAGDLWISNAGTYLWDSDENDWALWDPSDWIAQYGPVALWRSERVNSPLPCGPITWNITASAATRRNATVTVRDMNGIVSVTEQEVAPDPTIITISEGEQADSNTWVEISGATVEVHSITRTAATGPVWRKCADEYLRNLRNVTVIDGPKIIRDYETSRGVLREVEVVFEAATPHTFHAPIPVLSVDRASVTSIPGVRVRTINEEVPMCEQEVVPNWRDALADPACPFDPPPPLPRAEPSTCIPPTRYGYSYEVYIPPGVVPEWGEMVPTLSIKAGPSIVRGIRARFHANPLGAPVEELDPCGECASYVVSFIPQGATFTADGVTEKAIIDVVGNSFTGLQYLDAALPGQDFTWPTLTCGVGYTILVEVSANNEIEGIELSLTERE